MLTSFAEEDVAFSHLTNWSVLGRNTLAPCHVNVFDFCPRLEFHHVAVEMYDVGKRCVFLPN